MRKVLLALLVGALALMTVIAWFFFDHLVIVWATVLSVIVKGTIFSWLGALLYRWIWTGLPRLVLGFLYRIGAPHWLQRRVRRAIALSKLVMLNTMDAVVQSVQKRVGVKTAFVLALTATAVIGVLAFVFMGAYVVWLVGPSRIFASLEWILIPIGRWLQNFLFRLLANTGLLRLWGWLISLIPETYRRNTRAFWWGVIRKRRRFLDKTKKLRKLPVRKET